MIVQIGQPLVEIVRLVGGAVVAALESIGKVELQPGLEAERDIAEAHWHAAGH